MVSIVKQLPLTFIRKKIKCKKAGLVVHPEYSFFAASPDSYADPDGIVEVKCPYSSRHSNPQNLTLPYLDNTGKLKTHHNYYYQIQGQLEMTDREWCDFVVYTFHGIKIERIQRNREMYNKLKEFYYFYLLPSIVESKIDLPLEGKRWTTLTDICLLPSGLVNDPTYYKNISNTIGYTVAYFENIECPFHQDILIEDFDTLSKTKWLSNVVMDVTLAVLDSQSKFQLIAFNCSNIIFYNDHYTDCFLTSVTINKPMIAMPVLVNKNHWCLVLADIKNKQFQFMDPHGSTKQKTLKYLNKFLYFIQEYNKLHAVAKIPFTDWNIKIDTHLLQNDSFNCGVYCLYFFKQIINSKALTDEKCMEEITKELQFLLLHDASPMHLRCLFCARITDNTEDTMTCVACKRSMHIKCLRIKKIIQSPYYLCMLCQVY